MDYRMKSGRLLAGAQMRIVDPEGNELPWDGESTGEIEVRGPWITGRGFGNAQPEKFRDGWLRTGDIGTMDDQGYFQISDRLKDVIKSGGEWISSSSWRTCWPGARTWWRRPSSASRTKNGPNGPWPVSSSARTPTR
jgi:acyl-CoA synthetase (AMP-forming)/AMP-acid ligase II